MKVLRRRRLALCARRVSIVSLGVCLACAFVLSGCKRKAVPRGAEDATSEAAETSLAGSERPRSQEVNAAWYDVPLESLAKRRAAVNELTAAHNKLPIGTLVHVTHLANGKSVNVRITDRGIHDRRVKLDLCKEAAEELGMVSKGIARVRMEVLPEDKDSTPRESSNSGTP